MQTNRAALPLPLALILHLAPGIGVALFYLIAGPLLVRSGYPYLLALLLGFAVAGIPIQLAVLRTVSARRGESAVRNRVPQRAWQYIAGAVALIVIVGLLLRLPLSPVSHYLATRVFAFLPLPFTPQADDGLANFGRGAILATLIMQLIIDGIVNPLVEERYFRGFLLAEIEKLRWVAPVVNTALFALGHLWQPYNYVSIFIYVLPLTYFTWWRRNYYVQAFIHCLANSIGATIALIMFFRGTL